MRSPSALGRSTPPSGEAFPPSAATRFYSGQPMDFSSGADGLHNDEPVILSPSKTLLPATRTEYSPTYNATNAMMKSARKCSVLPMVVT